MPAAPSFLDQLNNFKHEADAAAQYLYSDMAVQHAASRSRKLLGRLNMTPTFWLTHAAGMQVAAYVAIARVFDTKSPYNVKALLDTFEQCLTDFSRSALAERKREGSHEAPNWLSDYLGKAHYPTKKDVERLVAKVAEYRKIYDRAIKPARHKYIAHREKTDHAEVKALFAGGKVRELWRLVTFLHALHDALWQQYHNGRKPVLRAVRYSVRAIYESRDEGRTGPHERIVAETRKLMAFIESATANSDIERTPTRRRRSASAHVGRYA